jgi:hypothetical protein
MVCAPPPSPVILGFTAENGFGPALFRAGGPRERLALLAAFLRDHVDRDAGGCSAGSNTGSLPGETRAMENAAFAVFVLAVALASLDASGRERGLPGHG